MKECKYSKYDVDCIYPDDENCLACLKEKLRIITEMQFYYWNSLIKEEKRWLAIDRSKDS